jgi:tRNA-splicing ligase RtcB
MGTAMRLLVAVAGALIPDIHDGYGISIGGALATRNTKVEIGTLIF